MRKKLLALLLVCGMLGLLMAGCGSAQSTASVPESSAASAEESTEAREPETESAEEPVSAGTEEASAPAEDSASGEESEAAEASEAEPEEPKIVIEYPLGSGLEVNFWTEFDNNAFGSAGLNSYNELACVDAIEEVTGVRYVYTEASFFSASEQFNLMIASGDWPDTMKASRYYSGGLAQAYADDIILDLSDLLPTAAPDYYAAYEGRDKATQDNITTNGRHLQMVSMYDDYVNDGGSFVRADWLDALGVSFPTDYAEFMDLLRQVHDAYGCSHTYPIDPGAAIAGAEDYYGTELLSLRSDNSSLSLFVEDGKVVSGATTDGFRRYLEDISGLYADGVINGEFYVTELDRGSTMGFIGDGNIFIWSGRADSMNDPLNYTSDPEMRIEPVRTYFAGEDGVYDFMDEVLFAATNEGTSVTTTCADPELVLNFYNYFFTEEGSMFTSYGIEDVTYTMENGTPQFTDLLLNNPDGMNFNMAMAIYGVNGIVGLTDNKAKLAAYSDEVVSAIEVFSDLEGTSTKYTYPSAASLTAEQATSVATPTSDVTAYAAEQCMKYVIGAEELTDESWNTYVETCNSMGLQKVVDTYQEAYDDYMSQE